MDSFGGFEKWGLLWVIVGVVVWVWLRQGRASATQAMSILDRPDEGDPEEPSLLPSGEWHRFPVSNLVIHSVETIEAVNNELRGEVSGKDQSALFLLVSGLTLAAYRVDYDRDLEEEDVQSLIGMVAQRAESAHETLFGPWEREEEDASEFDELLLDEFERSVTLWEGYRSERDRGFTDVAWLRSRRANFDEVGNAVWVRVESRVADLIRERLDELSQSCRPSREASEAL